MNKHLTIDIECANKPTQDVAEIEEIGEGFYKISYPAEVEIKVISSEAEISNE